MIWLDRKVPDTGRKIENLGIGRAPKTITTDDLKTSPTVATTTTTISTIPTIKTL